MGLRLAQYLRQLGEHRRNALRLVTREQLASVSATRFFFEILVGERLPVGVFHDETAIQLLDEPGRRKVAFRQRLSRYCAFGAPDVGAGAAPVGAAFFFFFFFFGGSLGCCSCASGCCA
jgi:hypothetical protein